MFLEHNMNASQTIEQSISLAVAKAKPELFSILSFFFGALYQIFLCAHPKLDSKQRMEGELLPGNHQSLSKI